MVKKALLLLSASVCLLNVSKAQKSHCYADQVNNQAKLEHPEIAAYEAQLKADINRSIRNFNFAGAKTTYDPNDSFMVYDVPIVFHVVHDYNTIEYVTDNAIYKAVDEINELYNNQNADTIQIIPTYRGKIPGTVVKYVAKTKIRFHLATIDPEGNPTHGITRRRSYLSNTASDQAKYDIWPPQSYINIWVVRAFNSSHESAAAYAYKPPTAAVIPYYDGVISYMGQPLNYDNTIAHELGHSLNLDHPWGATNDPNVACGDDDVDDTPPTKGHNPSSCANLAAIYDTACTYKKTQVGKINLNFAQDKLSSNNNEGIHFRTNINQVFIDKLSFYPADSGKPYAIALKHNGNVLTTYNGFTTDNKTSMDFANDFFDFNAGVADTFTNIGIKFITYDTAVIKSVNFYSSVPSQPYQVVLKHGNTVINSYSGVTSLSGNDTAFVNFPIPEVDSTTGYTITFAHNPGAKRDPATYAYANKAKANFIKIVKDSTSGLYNYFYHWNLQTFDYKQIAPVNFKIEYMDTASTGNYSVEFTQNPGARRDSSVGLLYPTFVADVLDFTNDNSQSIYNYFYDWNIRYGYYKRYDTATAHRLFGDPTVVYVDYPDTTNAQNVMDYTYCSKMFTYLQGVRMRSTLESNVANRSNLISANNLAATGALNPKPDLAPIADFNLDNEFNRSFICQNNQSLNFYNRSWNDTVNKLDWTLSNGASTPTATQTSGIDYTTGVGSKFSDTGWVTISLTASSNAGSNTVTKNRLVYVADGNTVPGNGYVQEFSSANSNDIGMFPIFNYYNNEFKWELVNNAGYYDNSSIRYTAYDKRQGTQVYYGTPTGDFDDFFTRAFDLSAMTSGNCNLSFMSAGAFVTNLPSEMDDTLEISYSTNCGTNWTSLKKIGRSELANNGTLNYDFTPAYAGQWKAQSINIPTAGRSSKVYFRFRYFPNRSSTLSMGTGNNFYIDRLSFNAFPTGVNPVDLENKQFALAPNPTTGGTSVVTKNVSGPAQVIVTDVTGKVVYSTNVTLNGSVSHVDIPGSYIAVKGVYLVQLVSGGNKHTEKLVVY